MREVAVTGGDRVEAQIRFGWSVNGYGVGDLVARMAEVGDAEIDRLVADYEERYARRRRRCAAAASGTASCATPRARRPACAASSRRAAFTASPPRSRTCTGSSSCPACRCSA